MSFRQACVNLNRRSDIVPASNSFLSRSDKRGRSLYAADWHGWIVVIDDKVLPPEGCYWGGGAEPVPK